MHESNIHSERMVNLRAIIREKKIDAFFTIDQANIFYLTGFSGSTGALIVTDDESILLTDFRYALQCKSEVKSASIIIYKKSVEIFDHLNEMKIKVVGFNSFKITHDFYLKLKKLLKGKKLKNLPGAVESLRQIKDPHELKIMSSAAKRAGKSLDMTLKSVKAGDSEIGIKTRLEHELRVNGCEKESFDTIVVSGKNSALIHGKPSTRKIKPGDLVLIDFGGRYKGYCSDNTCTFILGEPTAKQKKIYSIVKEAQRRAISGLKDGVSAKRISGLAREYIKKNGYGDYFMHGLGHGIGLEVHELPFLSSSGDFKLREGMVLTIEPGIYIEDFGGIRIEDMLYITKTGSKRLTNVPKTLEIK